MSDQAATAAQPTAQAAAAQPGAQAPAAPGDPQIDRNEYERLKRDEQRFRGSQKFYEAASKHGFKDEAAFEEWGPTLAAWKQRGFTAKQLAAAFSQPERETGREETEPDIDSRFRDLESRLRRENYEREHVNNSRADREYLEDQFINQTVGEDAPEPLRKLMARAARDHYAELRRASRYEDGHPLAGDEFTKPLGRAGREAIEKFLKEQHKAVTDGFSAARAAKVGAAAQKQTTATTAGINGGNGAPQKEALTKEERTRSALAKAAAAIGAKS